jgi:hypothetical protein
MDRRSTQSEVPRELNCPSFHATEIRPRPQKDPQQFAHFCFTEATTIRGSKEQSYVERMATITSVDIKDNASLRSALRVLRQWEAQAPSVRLHLDLATGNRIDPVFLEILLYVLQITTCNIEEATVTLPSANNVSHSAKPTMQRACSMIASIPTLRTLSWRGEGTGPTSMEYIAKAMINARRTVRLNLWGFVFVGTFKDFFDFAVALYKHPTLKEISIASCTLEDAVCTNVNVDPILMALATVPNLTDLALSGFVPSGKAHSLRASNTIRDLCAHPNLRSLDLLDTRGRGLLVASKAIQISRITTLCVDTSLLAEEIYQLGCIIRYSKTIQDLHVYLDSFKSDDSLHLLIQALNKNRGPRRLEFIFQEPDKYFSEGIQTALVDMLENHNFKLHFLSFRLSSSLDVRNVQTESIIEYYLCLNRLGRNHLLRNSSATSNEDWISTLESAGRSLDLIYYFLSQNPSLCGACGET